MSRAGRFKLKLEELPAGITQLLEQWSDGDQEALDEVISRLYEHLHSEASRHLNQLHIKGDSLQATALVNEAYMKFRKKDRPSFMNRQQFFWFSSQMIRHIIVDHIRARSRQKRKNEKVSLEEEFHGGQQAGAVPGQLDIDTLLAINTALSELESANPRRSQVVTLRFILGMSIQETAEVMELSLTTVKEDWNAAKKWLFKKLNTNFT